MHVSDTQHLAEFYPELYNDTMQWIADYSRVHNVKMVVCTGDLLNDGSNVTQWEVANSAFGILDDDGIPYAWCAGNHDYYDVIHASTNNSQFWIGNNYDSFNPEIQSQKSYWVSSYNDGTSTAVRFSVNHENYLLINLQYLCNQTVIDWAEQIIQSYPNDQIILTTHSYISSLTDDNYDDTNGFSTALQSMMNKYKNIFLTLSGHDTLMTTPIKLVADNGRNEVGWNLQEYNEKRDGSAVMKFIFETDGSISSHTYNCYYNSWGNLTNSDWNYVLYRNTTIQTESVYVTPIRAGVYVYVPSSMYAWTTPPSDLEYTYDGNWTSASSTAVYNSTSSSGCLIVWDLGAVYPVQCDAWVTTWSNTTGAYISWYYSNDNSTYFSITGQELTRYRTSPWNTGLSTCSVNARYIAIKFSTIGENESLNVQINEVRFRNLLVT